MADSGGDMALAQTGGAEQQEVGGLINPGPIVGQGAQSLALGGVKSRRVERAKRFADREPSLVKMALQAPLFALGQLVLA